MENRIIMVMLMAVLVAPLVFAAPAGNGNGGNGLGWIKRIASSFSFGPEPDEKPGVSWNETAECTWINTTANCSWLNMTTNCSWLNTTTNCSWLNRTTDCSWINQTVNCSWVNSTINGSVVLVPVNCSWLNVTTNCSWVNQTVNCSWLNVTTDCAWINRTVNCSWINVSECPGNGEPGNKQKEPKITPGAYRGFSLYRPSLRHVGVGITGTEGLSEFHIVRFWVIQARKVSPQFMRRLIDETDDYEDILEYLKNRAVTYWGTMTLGETGYHFEASFEGETMSGTIYESIPTSKLNSAMMGLFDAETAGGFTLTRETYEGEELWRGTISIDNRTYTNTFIFGQPLV